MKSRSSSPQTSPQPVGQRFRGSSSTSAAPGAVCMYSLLPDVVALFVRRGQSFAPLTLAAHL